MLQQASSAKYIVQQYIAATGGVGALDSLKSMYAVGQVRMFGSEMREGGDTIQPIGRAEVGGFVLWQKNPNLWHFELVVSGFKVSAGSDGKVAWTQSSSQPCHANKSPPRPLRRFFQVHKHSYNKQSANCVIICSCAPKSLYIVIHKFVFQLLIIDDIVNL